MVSVTALKNFTHHGRRRIDDIFVVSEQEARGLERAKLVRIGSGFVNNNPQMAAGEKSSALPPAPASQQMTSKKSDDGETTEVSSEPKRRGRRPKVHAE